MKARCISWENMIWDKCRFCSGYKTECPEYLSDIEHTRQTKHTSLTRGEVIANENETRISSNSLSRDKTAENYSKPFYFGHNEPIHNIVLPKSKLLGIIRQGLRGIQ